MISAGTGMLGTCNASPCHSRSCAVKLRGHQTLDSQVYGDEASTVIAGLQPLDGGEADFFAMASAGEAHVDLEALRCVSCCLTYRPRPGT